MDKLRVSIKITQPIILVLLLMGCAHSVKPAEPVQDKTITKLTPDPISWHDGSKGGEYGIGIGWSIELLPAEYETVTETIVVNKPNVENRLPLAPPVYVWVAENTAEGNPDEDMIVELKTIPAKYETHTETVVVEAAKIEYYLTDTLYSIDGRILTPALVKMRTIPAVTKEEERRVVVSPLRMEEHYIPAPKKEGHRLVLKTPTSPLTYEHGTITKTVPRTVEVRPWRFIITNPDKKIAHTFDDFVDFKAFVNSLR